MQRTTKAVDLFAIPAGACELDLQVYRFRGWFGVAASLSRCPHQRRTPPAVGRVNLGLLLLGFLGPSGLESWGEG